MKSLLAFSSSLNTLVWADAKSAPLNSSGLHFLVFEDRSKRGLLNMFKKYLFGWWIPQTLAASNYPHWDVMTIKWLILMVLQTYVMFRDASLCECSWVIAEWRLAIIKDWLMAYNYNNRQIIIGDARLIVHDYLTIIWRL